MRKITRICMIWTCTLLASATGAHQNPIQIYMSLSTTIMDRAPHKTIPYVEASYDPTLIILDEKHQVLYIGWGKNPPTPIKISQKAPCPAYYDACYLYENKGAILKKNGTLYLEYEKTLMPFGHK